MKPADHEDWQRTSPLAILFFLGKTVQLVAKNAVQGLAPLIAFLVAYKGDIGNKIVLAAIAISVLVALSAILNYWFFRFQLREDSILLRHGVLKKKQLDIKFDRIQGINVQQNIVYRYLGLVTVSFDTAGSSGDEGNLPAVTREYADALRRRIGNRNVSANVDATAEAIASAPLMRLGWRDMVRIGMADRRALILFAFVGPVIDYYGDGLEAKIEAIAETAMRSGLQVDSASGVSLGVAVFIIAVLSFSVVSIAAAFLRYHNFELFLDGSTLRSQGGLLTRHEHSMDLGKIQTLRLQQSVVMRWLGRFKFIAHQATSSRKRGNAKVFTIPLLTHELADDLRTRFLAPEGGSLTQDPLSKQFRAISPYSMRTKFLLFALLPAILMIALAWQEEGMQSLSALLWVPIASAAIYRNWKRAGYAHDDNECVRRSGFLGYRTVAFLFRKVQRITVSQSRYQRRKNLASVRVYLASGSVRIPYIDYPTATRLRDYILYKVESSQLGWH